jgi:tight adherence protein B
MSGNTIFLVMIFIVVLLLSQAFVTPVMGSNATARRRLRGRIRELSIEGDSKEHMSLVRQKYLRKLSPTARRFESLPALEPLRTLIEQAGKEYLAYHVVLAALAIGMTAGLLTGLLFGWDIKAPIAAIVGLALPFLWLRRVRAKRLAKFEEQLPDALSIVARSLQAGLPFSEAMSIVGSEMADPIAAEFQTVFNEINYGGSVRGALLGMLERIPSVAVMAMVSAILIQRESGGNLAEVLDRISTLVRQRFRFQRSVKTMTAEGRMTAWVVALMPFGLGGVMHLLDPNWLAGLTENPLGQHMITIAFVMLVIGILWIRKLVTIDV